MIDQIKKSQEEFDSIFCDFWHPTVLKDLLKEYPDLKTMLLDWHTQQQIALLKAVKKWAEERINYSKEELEKHKDEIKRFGGWWERKCLVCGLENFDDEKGDAIIGGAGGGPNGENTHRKTKGEDCGGLIKEIWHKGIKNSVEYNKVLQDLTQEIDKIIKNAI